MSYVWNNVNQLLAPVLVIGNTKNCVYIHTVTHNQDQGEETQNHSTGNQWKAFFLKGKYEKIYSPIDFHFIKFYFFSWKKSLGNY